MRTQHAIAELEQPKTKHCQLFALALTAHIVDHHSPIVVGKECLLHVMVERPSAQLVHLCKVFARTLYPVCRVALKSETRRVRGYFLPLIMRFHCHRAYAFRALPGDVNNRGKQTWLLIEGAQ